MQYLLCTKNESKPFSYINSPGSCPHPTQKKKKNNPHETGTIINPLLKRGKEWRYIKVNSLTLSHTLLKLYLDPSPGFKAQDKVLQSKFYLTPDTALAGGPVPPPDLLHSVLKLLIHPELICVKCVVMSSRNSNMNEAPSTFISFLCFSCFLNQDDSEGETQSAENH